MSTLRGDPGFILLDGESAPIAFNHAALQILAYPLKTDQITYPEKFLRDRLHSKLLSSGSNGTPAIANEYKSGLRRYLCRLYRCDFRAPVRDFCNIAVLLERLPSLSMMLNDTLEQFELTPREFQTVTLLIEGLTSKEIATRMNISTNTVKAFLRLVMVKMNVSTRSGIVGKIVGPHPWTGLHVG